MSKSITPLMDARLTAEGAERGRLKAEKERDTLAQRCRELELSDRLLPQVQRQVEVLSGWHANALNELCDVSKARDTLRAEVEALRQFVEFVRHAPVSSGVCCCGDDMSRHGDLMSCGHMPVDEWDHALRGWLEQLGVEP